MTPETREALVQVFRTIERLGKKPTNPVVFRTVRAIGFSFRDAEAKALFAAFRDRAAPAKPQKRPDVAPVSEHERPDAANSGPDLAGASRERDKGIPSSNGSNGVVTDLTVSNALPLFSGSAPSAPARRQRPKVPDEMLAGFAVRDAVLELVRPHLVHITPKGWKDRYGKVAKALSDAGTTPEDAVKAWKDLCKREGRVIVDLWELQRYMVRGPTSNGKRHDPNNFSANARGVEQHNSSNIEASVARRLGEKNASA